MLSFNFSVSYLLKVDLDLDILLRTVANFDLPEISMRECYCHL